ncbi:MAG: hypothetical protein GY744_18310 [Gammaproteobacteria bacterium]|nr:hypothetical protein [Gammaproteobacteria bacterium]
MKTQIQYLLTVQLVFLLIYCLLVFLLKLGDVFSALTGCLASLLPSIYFSYKMLRQLDNNNAVEWLSYTYRSDVSKWLMAGIIFVLAFTSDYQWDPLILFVGYLLVQMSGIFVPIFFKGK